MGRNCLAGKVEHEPATTVCDELIEIRAHLIDTGLMNLLLDAITEAGGMFEIHTFEAGTRRDQPSHARVRVIAPTQERLRMIMGELIQHGARVVTEEADALLKPVDKAGVAPEGFYSTTIYPTDVRVEGQWVRAERQRMDAIVVVEREDNESPRARCTLIRDLKQGDLVVCGVQGIRIHARHSDRREEAFSFMSSGVSSERRVELAVEETAWEMRRIRERSGKIVVVAGPVVVHTGGGPHLAQLIRSGYVQALLGGNAIAVHDLEQALFGTSLGVDMRRGVVVHGGHKHHLKAINIVRGHGSIAAAVKAGVVKQGIMYECVKAGIPFVLAGSIRDDGPLPETTMDLIQAQQEYADAIQGAEMILMLSSMLHSIGTGNMTPSGVKLICVDISPAVVTKLADRGSMESVGIVTDVGLFLNLLAARLGCAEEHG